MEYWIRLGLTTAMIVAIADKGQQNEDLLCRKDVKSGTLCANNKKCPLNDDCDDHSSCPCIDGYTSHNHTRGNRLIIECDDIHECLNNTHNCGPYSRCNNTIGGYFCSCNKGFRKGNITAFCPTDNKSENECQDINECEENPDICVANSACINTIGSFQCTCRSGFLNTSNNCIDINECKESKLDICGPYGDCVNTEGSYECACKDGYKSMSKKCVVTKCRGNPGICGFRGICYGRNNSITCRCQDGYKAVSLGLHYPQCNVQCKDKNETQPECLDDESECLLSRFMNSWTPTCSGNDSGLQNPDKLLADLHDLTCKFKERSTQEKEGLKEAGKFLHSVESVIQNLSWLLLVKMPISNQDYHIDAKLVTRSAEDGEVFLNNKYSSVHLSKETALGNDSTSVVGCLEYRNISKLLAGAELQNRSVKLVSPVLSVFLGTVNTNKFSQPIQLRLNFTEKVTSNELHCAFWSVQNNSWSTEGCTTFESDPNGVVCNCTHLTSFAVLMSLHNIESWTLDLITQIGLSISIVCLALAIITFCCCRILRGTRNTIHIHLCVSLLLGHFIFLIGINAQANPVACPIVAGLLHFFYLSAFCWMSLEGLELYLMLVEVFKTQVKTRYLLAAGYGVPIVIIAISASVNPKGYGTKNYCWLSLDDNFIWSFIGPVCVIILVNCGIFVLTVWKLTEKMTTLNPEQGKLKRLRTLTVTSVAQLCILGCCWAFGFLMFRQASLFFAYAFTICNVLQGVQIFFLHCLMNKKIREIYANLICALAHFRSPIYSEFTNSSNVNTHSRAKLNKESGL